MTQGLHVFTKEDAFSNEGKAKKKAEKEAKKKTAVEVKKAAQASIEAKKAAKAATKAASAEVDGVVGVAADDVSGANFE
jgi:hypothetical protein